MSTKGLLLEGGLTQLLSMWSFHVHTHHRIVKRAGSAGAMQIKTALAPLGASLTSKNPVSNYLYIYIYIEA